MDEARLQERLAEGSERAAEEAAVEALKHLTPAREMSATELLNRQIDGLREEQRVMTPYGCADYAQGITAMALAIGQLVKWRAELAGR